MAVTSGSVRGEVASTVVFKLLNGFAVTVVTLPVPEFKLTPRRRKARFRYVRQNFTDLFIRRRC